MEEMILEAIEDAGAQGASFRQIADYVQDADIDFTDEQEETLAEVMNTMVRSRQIIARRGRFFIASHD